MENTEMKAAYEQLHKLLIEERQAAIALDMEALRQSTQAKKELLSNLETYPNNTDGLRDLLLEIDKENRRNAYLLWTGLGWVRSMMGFFGQSTSSSGYGQNGQICANQQEGHLVSGKV